MASGIEERIRELGLLLPEVPAIGGTYIPARTLGQIVYLSGVISSDSSGIVTWSLGEDRTIEEGYDAARSCAMTLLAILKKHLGSLDKVRSIVTLNGYVNAVAGFPDSPKVINGASDLLVQVFGEAGRHVRAAIGVSALPRHALVEVQMTVEIEPT